ncbi:hypothetical protein BGX31_010752 [Mortierella sp. GBA43]|nr:hypothetical protein BGX31_010752 [Mortierella sp. GBA43]
MKSLLSLLKRFQSLGLPVVLGFLLCIFQSSESILVKLASTSNGPYPSSAKLLFLSELLKLFKRGQLVGSSIFRRRRCCRSTVSCCKDSSRNSVIHDQSPTAPQDEEGQLYHSKQHLLSDSDDSDDSDAIDSPSAPTPSSRCRIPPILYFAVPGAIYFFNNNLTFVLLSLMPAPTYVVLSNLKILTTGLFSYLFLKRVLATTQWVSLGILFLSTAVSQVDIEKGLSLSISLQAFLLMVLFCSLSATAAVFSEYVMKERFADESIHLQNMKLYMFGILFNGVTYLLTPAVSDQGASFFADLHWIHFFIILVYASLGLVTSAIIKFSGSITKVYASSMSMFFAALVSWLLLNDRLTVLFFVGCFGCCFALHLYNRVPAASTPSSPDTSSSITAASERDDEEAALTAEEQGNATRNSRSSSIATLVGSPTARVKPYSNLLEAVKVVDRNEYVALETVDDTRHDQGFEKK